LVSNKLDLRSPPSTVGASSEVRVLSGANGTLLWKASNPGYAGLGRVLDLNAERGGLPQPVGGPNVQPFVDVDGDGVCDIFTYGFTPGPPSASALVAGIRPFTLDVRVLSGKTGKVLWKTTFAGQRVTES